MIKLSGKIIDQTIVPNNRIIYLNGLVQYEGKEIELTIKEHRESVSVRQHRYYRGGIIGFVCKHYLKNITTERLHKYYQKRFLTREDELGDYTFSTSELNTKQMHSFIEKVRMDLRHPDNLWKIVMDTATPEEYWEMTAIGTWE